MNFRLLFIFAFAALIASCSSDDNSNNSTTNYLPLETGNYWTYNVSSANMSNRDSLYVANDTVINSKNYKKIKTSSLPFGFFSNFLHNKGLRKEGSSLLVSGNTGLIIGGILPIDLSLNDFVIFKETAAANEQLSSKSGIINQDFQGYALTSQYAMQSTAIETLSSFTTPDNKVYTDVKVVKTTLNLKISTNLTITGIPFPVTVAIMNPQDVVTSIQYFSKNVGMIYANTTISYHLEDFSQFGISLPLPLTGNEIQNESLDTYHAE